MMLSRRAQSSVHLLLLMLWMIGTSTTKAWVLPPSATSKTNLMKNRPTTKLNGVFDFLSPYESKIPEELRDEIYQAEANTPAAKDRSQRVALYALVAFVGVGCAFFNGFLTELRAGGPDGAAGVDLAEAGFDWVTSNFLFSFLFTNKIGGALCLLFGAGSGLLAEAELETKRINAEKIYEELERRRDAKMKPKKKKKAVSKKLRRSGKEKKRLAALSELIVEDEVSVTAEKEGAPAEEKEAVEDTPKAEEVKTEEKKEGGLLGGIKDLYGKADAMAASQALLLNKQLEDSGMIDKITDETGLKVIGKEAADKIKEESGAKNNSGDESK